MIDEPARASHPARGRIELATAGMFVVLIAGALIGFPVLRETLVEAARSTVDRIVPARWAAYYLEIDAADPRARTDPEGADAQLMYASGSLPGRAARLLSAPVFTGTWSPNGERFVATSGSRVFLADRDGQAKLLTELRDLRPTGPPLWNGDEQLLFGATRTGQQHWLVTLDARTGTVLDQRDIGIGIQPWSASRDGKWVLALDRRTGTGILLETATGRQIQPRPRESFAAWLRDGRVIVTVALESGSRIVARRPDGDVTETLLELDGLPLVPASATGDKVAIIEARGRDGSGPRSVWLVAPGAQPVRVATGLGRVYMTKPSRDGRFVGFSEAEEGTPITVRAGVVEVATGKVTYACDAGCAVLDVR